MRELLPGALAGVDARPQTRFIHSKDIDVARIISQ
tara:strand:- start:133441 stop:133545 length:105 start_codon:yes stop_codon:yes gene_type:complete